MNHDLLSSLLESIFARLNDLASDAGEPDEKKFATRLNSTCAGIVVQLVSHQKGLTQTQREALLSSAIKRVRSLIISSTSVHMFPDLWQTKLRELESKLNTFLCIIQMTSSGGTEDAGMAEKIEFQNGTTVAYLAAHTRVAWESGLFRTRNKTEICRMVSAVCSTQKCPAIQPHSFRKHFNDPPLDALDKVEQILERQTKITRTLKSRSIQRIALNP